MTIFEGCGEYLIFIVIIDKKYLFVAQSRLYWELSSLILIRPNELFLVEYGTEDFISLIFLGSCIGYTLSEVYYDGTEF